MGEVDQNGKCYVEVIAHFSDEGTITPLEIILDSGRRFRVDRVTERRYAPSLKCGGYGYRYTVMISGKPHFLWQDEKAFYVQMGNNSQLEAL